MADTDQYRLVAESIDARLETEFSSVSVTVLLMGPGIPIGDIVKDDNEPSVESLLCEQHGERLREFLYRKCAAENVDVMAEHPELMRIIEDHPFSNLADYEIQLVQESDVLVIVPDSPGSFCELGLFSMYEEFCKKMVVLCNESELEAGTYIHDGPITAARNGRAIVESVSYEEGLNEAWEIVKQEIDKTREQLLRQRRPK